MSHDVKRPPPSDKRLTTEVFVSKRQSTVPGCAQTTLAALAKRQFGGLKRHLCHTLELGVCPMPLARNLRANAAKVKVYLYI